MDDDDFRFLIALLEEQFRDVGAPELADPKNYLAESEDGETRLARPFDRVMAMLKAFDRKMAVEDRQTFDAAMASMNAIPGMGGPRGAIVELAREESLRPTIVDLGNVPNLRGPRVTLRSLIEQVHESRSPEGPA